jgi:2-polyprenyl-6-methoxyphenol hydroxylase-like FAD-dependent oxidoreductase
VTELDAGKFRDIPSMLKQYEKNRMSRALTVQRIAQMIATVGQLKSPIMENLRNVGMRLVPQSIKGPTFDTAVKYSLGWNYHVPHLSTVRTSH